MHPSAPAPSAPRHRARAARPTRAAALLLAGALVLAGCGLRLETPPPAEPTPDATEQVRARTVGDALALASAAAALSAQGVDEAVRPVLDDVAAFSTRHVEELGGVYESGLPDPSPTATPTPAPELPEDVATLLTALSADADAATRDADAVPDGALARLVGSVAVARDALTDRLAAAAGLPRPDRAPATDDDAEPAAAPDASAPTTDAPDDATSPAPDGAPEAAAVALAHDEAAWTFTVLAARSADDRRAALLAAAARHEAASDRWATAAGVAGRPTDPRRAAYALPAALDDPAVADALPRTLEQAVADACAAAVATAAPGARGDALTCLREATSAATAAGAAVVPFPGMAELATAPVG
ncbi:DUF4439 domain-containing protein [Cellulomonas iranensis]|uniref:DUF4439 domain-containing protein n=2 Tax=Cellulomonas iranensis TaxID=76862 RepID=A0ABU0GGG3_9CELL|nr:DUF4439 domain-containing protein [Cellulomonas iranensis]MDQ0423831.1 hypothetical protein [Cellulomonas iranensis]